MPFGRVCGRLLDDAATHSIMSEFRDIRVPAELCDAAQQKFGSSFASVEQLVTFLLQELVHADTSDLDKDDQALVEERLRDLGYI